MNEKATKVAQLRLRVTDAARNRILKFLGESNEVRPIPGILLSSSHQWNIGLYGQEQIEHLQDLFNSKGLVLLHEADGIEFCIPQPQLVAQLEGKTLDYRDDQYVVL